MPGGALREYPGRDSNPQCPRGRTAFKAADFASLSTRARVVRIVRGRSRIAARCREPGRGVSLTASRPAQSPAPDRRRVARSLGWFYLAAPLVAEAWLAVEAPRTDRLVPMLAVCVLAQVLGGVLVRGSDDAVPAPLLKGLLTVASVFVAGLCAASGSPSSGFAYLFLWA